MPTWFEAVLLNSWVAVNPPRYCKNGTGSVFLSGAIKKSDTPESSEAILQLPVGYRPKYNVPVLIMQAASQTWGTYGWIMTDGSFIFNTAEIPAEFVAGASLAFSASFQSAN